VIEGVRPFHILWRYPLWLFIHDMSIFYYLIYPYLPLLLKKIMLFIGYVYHSLIFLNLLTELSSSLLLSFIFLRSLHGGGSASSLGSLRFLWLMNVWRMWFSFITSKFLIYMFIILYDVYLKHVLFLWVGSIWR